MAQIIMIMISTTLARRDMRRKKNLCSSPNLHGNGQLGEPMFVAVVHSGGGGIPALPEGMLLPMVCFVATLHHLLPPNRPTDGPNCATHRLIGIRLPSPSPLSCGSVRDRNLICR